MFSAACEWSMHMVERSLEKYWSTAQTTTGKIFYINNKTNRTQWTQPYRERTFRSNDVEEEAFISIALQRNLLSNRCVFYGKYYLDSNFLLKYYFLVFINKKI